MTGTIHIVNFHTHVHFHIEKLGNLSKSKFGHTFANSGNPDETL